MNDLKERIWVRDNGQCRRCHRTVYATYKMPAQGAIYHVNRDINDNADSNLILVCDKCIYELSSLYLKHPRKYLCQMELITQRKLDSLRDEVPAYTTEYRYRKVGLYIKALEEEDNIIALPNMNQEELVSLKAQKAKIEAEEIREVVNK